MKRIALCIAASATLVTTTAGPAVADGSQDMLRLFSIVIDEINRGERHVTRHRYYRDDDDDGRRNHRRHQRVYRYGDDDRGYRRGHAHRGHNDDD